MGGANYWGSPVTTGSQHYAREFAEAGWEVAYLSDQISPLHPLRWRSRAYNADKFRLWARGGVRDVDGRLFAYNHLTLLPVHDLPLLRSELAARRTLDWTVPRLFRKLDDEGFARPDVVWIDHLLFADLPRRLDAPLTIYRMADDPRLFPETNPPVLLRRADRLVREADVVVVTSERLRQRVRAERDGPVAYVPNGVEYGRFAAPPSVVPEEYRAIRRPRVVFVGSLEPWFDAGLVAAAARELPDHSFVVVGPARIPLDALEGEANVHVLGPRPYADVPGYMAHADVGIIPFRRSPEIDAVHPIKLYEYLAAGLPVVATAWDELRRLDAPVTLVEGRGEFAGAVAAAAREPGDPEPRRAFARANSWSRRFRRILSRLEEER